MDAAGMKRAEEAEETEARGEEIGTATVDELPPGPALSTVPVAGSRVPPDWKEPKRAATPEADTIFTWASLALLTSGTGFPNF